MKVIFRLSAVLVAVLFFFPLCGYSYIDLGSGSYIIQLIIAGFVGFSLSLRIFWKKIRSRLSKKAKTDETADGH